MYNVAVDREASGVGQMVEPELNLMSQMESLKMNEHIQGYEIARYLINEVFRPNNKSFAKPFRRPMPKRVSLTRELNTLIEECMRWRYEN